MNDSLLCRALRCEPVPRPPVWLMRQAGRYMPQYRALKKEHSLWELFHDPALAAQVTLLPLEVLGVDAAILFSDILIVVEALGLRLEFPEGAGPRVHPPIRTREQVVALPQRAVQEALPFVFETVARVKERCAVPLIGFCGGPFTVASYLIDSTSREAFQHTKEWLAQEAETLHELLRKITSVSIEYVQKQVAAGADVIQVFDSWANLLSDAEFDQFCLPYLQVLVEAVPNTPVILFCRSSSLRATKLAALKPAAISCDWHRSLADLRAEVPSEIAVQGNFDPALLLRPIPEIEAQVRATREALSGARGVVLNLGHGITPDVPVEHAQAFVRAASQNCNNHLTNCK